MEKFILNMDGRECYRDNGNENESLGDHILEEMESIWLDIDERLTILRMVSDSVIKGVVSAVEEQAAERIAQKELEVVGLKKMLHSFEEGSDTKTLGPSVPNRELHESATHHISDTVLENGGLFGSDSLEVAVTEQLKQLKKEINKIRGSSSIKGFCSGSDLVGLGGILQENVPERWTYVDKSFESLNDTLDALCRRVEIMDRSLKASLWHEELEFRSEIERIVISNCIWGLQQEFEEKLWDLYDFESRNCFDQHKEISNLRLELDSIFKALSFSETGLLISHGSLENGEEWCHSKRPDHFHWKLPTSLSLPLTLEENGKQENSKNSKHENLDPSLLKLESREELITYFNSEITKMRRNHECQLQEMTEENFRLKREVLNLKERGSPLLLKKDKDFDLLKKKIPHVISKLDKILVGNGKVNQFTENIESLSSLKDRLDFLLSENHQLKDTLTDKKKEIKSLSSQLSDVVEKLSLQQVTEKNLLQNIRKLEGDIGDAHTEVSVIQDVHKCLFEDITSEFRSTSEELHLKNSIMEEIYEIILKETAHSPQASWELEIEVAHMKSSIMQGLLDINQIIFKEALVDANKALKSEGSEKEELKQKVLTLTSMVEEREKLAQEAADALVQQKQKMELAYEQINSLQTHTLRQQGFITETNKELDATKGDLVAALNEIEQYKGQMRKLHQNLECRMNELREADDERKLLSSVAQKRQDALTLVEAKERETRKQMEPTIDLIHKLSTMVTDFEARVNGDMSKNCLRIENMKSEFRYINNKTNILKTTGLVYKQRLETKCSDLTKAEAEVDLLGDEVDTLLNLLEKIYIALDHYSPILQHYPGVIEILELIRRELNGESRKLV
ncbi:PREDICTED: WPP domain-associated protein-like isoform X1 [Lupinus angustifolius]|uniref:WPP domain-associated protein-like isoform X1 n=1 Tax=Lupinus angustifolius TaxID=3871 RepID=UPI00092F23B5|nr:PREDICTED: WPP domain-associated protein-like isoform X1 [Lupinus angustifolius]XP_019420012.1 PREDICTED: WPP domain-associated protein-like isoform X1 [Lupinus angustifolius]XP_019420013.1 PREDICTED: WPP domain-associated protein-like isoform X1 [Lupinus angustifolius]